MLALAWVPITSHCAWEHVPGLEFFKCLDDTPLSHNTAPASDGCGDEVCAQVESGSYKVSDTQTPVLPPCFCLFISISVDEAPLVESLTPLTAAPLEIPAGWSFAYRTALPPRAPSLA